MAFETAKLTIDLNTIIHNYHILKKTASKAVCATTLKANAYGMGAVQVGSALANAGCSTFFFAYMNEAVAFKEAVPQATQVFVLNGPYTKDAWAACQHYGLTPVLNTLENIESFNNFASNMPVALHVDTGMNRLGLGLNDYKKIKIMPNWCLIMSHLACADDPLNSMNFLQLKRLKEIQKNHPHVPFSLCNSSGVFLGNTYHFHMVRPGCGLYGINPTPGLVSHLTSCVRLEARILQIQTLSKGAGVGYGVSYVCGAEKRVATMALGYADGVPWQLCNTGANVLIRGEQVPILGRISMDLVTLDVTSIPNCSTDDWATVMDETQTPDYLAALVQTSPYEILLSLGNRAERVYLQAENPTTSTLGCFASSL
jgi:alanine racemase